MPFGWIKQRINQKGEKSSMDLTMFSIIGTLEAEDFVASAADLFTLYEMMAPSFDPTMYGFKETFQTVSKTDSRTPPGL